MYEVKQGVFSFHTAFSPPGMWAPPSTHGWVGQLEVTAAVLHQGSRSALHKAHFIRLLHLGGICF